MSFISGRRSTARLESARLSALTVLIQLTDRFRTSTELSSRVSATLTCSHRCTTCSVTTDHPRMQDSPPPSELKSACTLPQFFGRYLKSRCSLCRWEKCSSQARKMSPLHCEWMHTSKTARTPEFQSGCIARAQQIR